MFPGAALPRSYGQGDFPIDSLNLWPWLAGTVAHSPRRELVLGKMTGGALISQGTGSFPDDP